MNTSTIASTFTTSMPRKMASTPVLAQLGAALLLGFVMLYAVGFSEASVVHNAAHDVRHATGRPCH
ncbi:putative cobalt transporter subunit (CbtB) [mine drainage metagenome]|uniref:Putative cobalt transporter subunit (CbtB) n=1 Tax=mine drainage metagenome TaxID=410659 RepID=A0A1J5P2I5_9ZZZZ